MTIARHLPALPGTRHVRPTDGVLVEIAETPIFFETDDPAFRAIVESRYAGFLNPSATPKYQFKIRLAPSQIASDKDIEVFRKDSVWFLERGDFQADWDLQTGAGQIIQSPNPYSLDTVLRIVHSLVLVEQGGFLVHAASAIRNGRGFLFAGVSGAGKTTLSRLAPPDATVLTDEISYVLKDGDAYKAYGTPFAGELARVGTNVSAPLAGLYLLEKGIENKIEPIEPAAAAWAIMRHILFFAHDEELVKKVFDSVMTFVSSVRPARLIFTPDERAWELIR